MGDGITYVGLDVHKEGIVVAVAEDGVRGEAREIKPDCEHADGSGSVGGKVGRDGVKLRFRYKAGPCGYGIQPFVGARHECVVEAPSLIPKRPGNRVKTNRRDGVSLARLHRAGELTAVKVPDAEGEQRLDEPQRGYAAAIRAPRSRSPSSSRPARSDH
jgi:transposase